MDIGEMGFYLRHRFNIVMFCYKHPIPSASSLWLFCFLGIRVCTEGLTMYSNDVVLYRCKHQTFGTVAFFVL